MIAQSIINYLEKYTNEKIPSQGILAGQSVAEAYFRLLNIDIYTRIKDLDLFTQSMDQNPYSNSANKVNVEFSEEKILKIENQYELLIESIRKNYKIISVEENGIFNHIYINTSDEFLLQTIVNRFDINSVQIGINLQTKELYMSPYFLEFLNKRQLHIVNYHSFPSSLLRIIEKQSYYKGTYLNLDYEINYGMSLYSLRDQKGTYLLKHKYERVLNNKKAESYLTIFNKYFSLVEESFKSQVNNKEILNPEKIYTIEPFDNNYYYCESFFSYFSDYCSTYNIDCSLKSFILNDYIDHELMNRYKLNVQKITTTSGELFNLFYKERDDIFYVINNLLTDKILIPYSYHKARIKIFETVELLKANIQPTVIINDNLVKYFKTVDIKHRDDLNFIYTLKNRPFEQFNITNVHEFFKFIINFEEFDYVNFKINKLNTIFLHYKLFIKLYSLFKDDFKNYIDFLEHCYKFIKALENSHVFYIGKLESNEAKESLFKEVFFSLDINILKDKFKNDIIVQERIIPEEVLIFKNYTIRQLTNSLDLNEVGKNMKHCVGGYDHNLKTDDFFYFDIIDPNGIRITLEIKKILYGNNFVVKNLQMKLKKNQIPSEQQFYDIEKFLEQLQQYFNDDRNIPF